MVLLLSGNPLLFVHQDEERGDIWRKPVQTANYFPDMEAQYFWHLFLTLAWIFLFSFPSVCKGMNGIEIKLNTDVFVAFSGEELSVDGIIHKTANQTSEYLRCYDPYGQEIYIIRIDPTIGDEDIHLNLKNLSSSGLYSCKSNSAEVKWFLRVTDGESISQPLPSRSCCIPAQPDHVCFPSKAYREPQKPDYTEVFMMAVFTGVLLVFSVFASVYVFRGHWEETQSGSLASSRTRKQNTEERKETEKEEDNMDMAAAQSSSFYASLEPRPRSIYDVLDHSAANNDKERAKSPEKVEQIGEYQDEGIFESVYENF
ncbi:uncharacterized protein si:ch211-243a20.4 isoform X1 [Gambusia affinis]|uniref:uncharacterized protein si:ch211-243a20.4 isoform X1 n=1 Tax=Gambusia affinis TaxID=33528 RepID=UPI001CDD0C28|nr:uncharacterized protein si:ch211-243a20.4 isoform X1 [Gambusia affinis]